VCSFRIAVDRPKSRDGGEKQTDFFGVSVWRDRGERAAEFLQKGRLVLIAGRVQIREYTDREGGKRTSVDVTADDFQMLDSRPGAGAGQAAGPRQDQSQSQSQGGSAAGSNLPDFEYNEATDEEVPF